ncbi:MAG TPA: DUF2723 domain-containing protein [Bacteroidota bacterium]|nr:DUF2723 domain-containing protein [Bacteroidota bacterium]
MINRLTAAGVFIVTLAVYLRTLSVTVVFWDVGEFLAAAKLLQVPHPPGAPLFLLVGKVVSMVPFYEDFAARIHMISALAGALSSMFLYLVGVKLMIRMRGEVTGVFERFMVYGPAAVGAFAMSFSTSSWDNSIEAEVYGLGLFFVAVIVWLALRWWERSDEPHSERYLMMIAYLIGLSVGVHLLGVLALFSALMLIYFRTHEVTRQTALRFGAVALGIFFVVYPGVVQILPSMLDGDAKLPLLGNVENGLLPIVPVIMILAAIWYAWKSVERNQRMVHIACLSFLLIVLGYTTYTLVLIRANVPNLPMNENRPVDMAGLTAYLGREQYGDTPLLKGESWDNKLQDWREKLFPRRHSREGMHEATRRDYTSDFDFMWNYQINHMFTRYMLWNFVGQEGSWQDAGVQWKRTFGIPLFLGLFGIFYHFRKDWKLAFTFFVMFLIMGVVLALYQNQQDPQPRERDYFYGGAYYVFALWIGLGVFGIIELIRGYLKSAPAFRLASSGTLAVFTLAAPINLARINWFEHDRSGNYVAWDYSYNMLQSCKKDAILFTNGDNDTFPVWYLQDVEGVRRDVRVVNLSLVNTNWYIHEMKHGEPHGAKKVPISLSDAQIDGIMPMQWKPRQIDLPVPEGVTRGFLAETYAQMPVPVRLDSAVLREGRIRYSLNGVDFRKDLKVLRVQDIMVRDIITTNKWERPIFFAVTCSPDSKIGLDNYLWMTGQAYELKPIRTDLSGLNIDIRTMSANVLAKNTVPATGPQNGFLYRGLNNPGVFYNENQQRMALNYRAGFMQLADHASRTENDREKARAIMAQMDSTLPLDVIPVLDWRYMVYMMRLYESIDDTAKVGLYAGRVEEKCLELLAVNPTDTRAKSEAYQLLLEIYDAQKRYAPALDLLQILLKEYPKDPEINRRINRYRELMNAAGRDTNKPG